MAWQHSRTIELWTSNTIRQRFYGRKCFFTWIEGKISKKWSKLINFGQITGIIPNIPSKFSSFLKKSYFWEIQKHQTFECIFFLTMHPIDLCISTIVSIFLSFFFYCITVLSPYSLSLFSQSSSFFLSFFLPFLCYCNCLFLLLFYDFDYYSFHSKKMRTKKKHWITIVLFLYVSSLFVFFSPFFLNSFLYILQLSSVLNICMVSLLHEINIKRMMRDIDKERNKWQYLD